MSVNSNKQPPYYFLMLGFLTMTLMSSTTVSANKKGPLMHFLRCVVNAVKKEWRLLFFYTKGFRTHQAQNLPF